MSAACRLPKSVVTNATREPSGEGAGPQAAPTPARWRKKVGSASRCSTAFAAGLAAVAAAKPGASVEDLAGGAEGGGASVGPGSAPDIGGGGGAAGTS